MGHFNDLFCVDADAFLAVSQEDLLICEGGSCPHYFATEGDIRWLYYVRPVKFLVSPFVHVGDHKIPLLSEKPISIRLLYDEGGSGSQWPFGLQWGKAAPKSLAGFEVDAVERAILMESVKQVIVQKWLDVDR